ncbi:MAG: SPFH domain-containing protein, partial [Muribaculaceae bacterium]|nr:SPFH domain-containing protein [Muribaculaceae bacterium]
MDNNHEFEYKGMIINGFAMIFFTWILIPALMVCFGVLGNEENLWLSVGCNIPLFICFILGCCGYFTQEPGEARVMIFFGKYVG